jgi:hypothetical protein
MNAEQYRHNVENGQTPVTSHDQVLRIAFIYSFDPFNNDGVFGDVEKLHTRGWSFGHGGMKFNRYAF